MNDCRKKRSMAVGLILPSANHYFPEFKKKNDKTISSMCVYDNGGVFFLPPWEYAVGFMLDLKQPNHVVIVNFIGKRLYFHVEHLHQDARWGQYRAHSCYLWKIGFKKNGLLHMWWDVLNLLS